MALRHLALLEADVAAHGHRERDPVELVRAGQPLAERLLRVALVLDEAWRPRLADAP